MSRFRRIFACLLVVGIFAKQGAVRHLYSCSNSTLFIPVVCGGQSYPHLCAALNAGVYATSCEPAEISNGCYWTATYSPVCCGGDREYSNQAQAMCEGFSKCSPGQCRENDQSKPQVEVKGFFCPKRTAEHQVDCLGGCDVACPGFEDAVCVVKNCAEAYYNGEEVDVPTCAGVYIDKDADVVISECVEFVKSQHGIEDFLSQQASQGSSGGSSIPANDSAAQNSASNHLWLYLFATCILGVWILAG